MCIGSLSAPWESSSPAERPPCSESMRAESVIRGLVRCAREHSLGLRAVRRPELPMPCAPRRAQESVHAHSDQGRGSHFQHAFKTTSPNRPESLGTRAQNTDIDEIYPTMPSVPPRAAHAARPAQSPEPKRVFTARANKAADDTFNTNSRHFPKTFPNPSAPGLKSQTSTRSLQPCPPFLPELPMPCAPRRAQESVHGHSDQGRG